MVSICIFIYCMNLHSVLPEKCSFFVIVVGKNLNYAACFLKKKNAMEYVGYLCNFMQ